MQFRVVSLLAGLALMLGSLLANVPSACACSCAVRSIAEHYTEADVVFTGLIIAGEDPDAGQPTMSSAREVRYRITVDRVFKSDLPAEVWLASAAEGASCGLEVEVGRTYLFFALGGPALRANLCGGTQGWTPTLPDELGAGRPPLAQTDPAPTVSTPASDGPAAADPGSSGRPEVGPVALGALAVIVLAAAAAWWRRRG